MFLVFCGACYWRIWIFWRFQPACLELHSIGNEIRQVVDCPAVGPDSAGLHDATPTARVRTVAHEKWVYMYVCADVSRFQNEAHQNKANPKQFEFSPWLSSMSLIVLSALWLKLPTSVG